MWPETRSRKRRASNRRDTRVALEARAQGRTCATQLYDISPTGCRFDCQPWDLARGERIVFKFADEIKVAGTVAWRRRGSAGVEFDAPLPEVISRHLRFDGPGAAGEE